MARVRLAFKIFKIKKSNQIEKIENMEKLKIRVRVRLFYNIKQF